MRTWILAAHRGGAQLFERKARSRRPVPLEVFPHDEGRLKDGQIDSDRPGRSFDRFGAGRHAVTRPEAASEHLADTFAKAMAQVLHTGLLDHEYDELVLIAEPRFLGRLRANLSKDVAARVVREIAKDLPEPSVGDVERYLEAEA